MSEKPGGGEGGKPDWLEVRKDATPESVAWALLRPVNRKPPKEAK